MFVEAPDNPFLKALCLNFLKDVASRYKPHVWIPCDAPLFSIYNGEYVGDDISGDVRIADMADLYRLAEDAKTEEFGETPAIEFLSNIMTGSRRASYISRCGWLFTSYRDEIDRMFDDWMQSSYDLYDEDGDCKDEEFEVELRNIYEQAFENIRVEELLPMVLHTL